MTDIQAALGLSQLKKNDRFRDVREKIAEAYHRAFSRNDQIILPVQNDVEKRSAWHLYVLRLRRELEGTARKKEAGERAETVAEKRRRIYNALYELGLGVNVHYIPVYLHPYYRQLGYQKGLCPVSEAVYESMITLPLFAKMTEQDADRVIQATIQVMGAV
jgi:dTDP-4-amino-4,6-dideoxygalactose transaminase